MITAIYSLGRVHGAELWIVGWLVCAIAYFAIFLLNQANRRCVKNLLFWFMVAEILTDLGWAAIYYDNSAYINYGIRATYGLILWPIALNIAGIIATIQNKKQI